MRRLVPVDHETGHNEPYANFGCAQQHNIAALVANPQDLNVPRTSTPPDAMRRSKVISDYRTGRTRPRLAMWRFRSAT
jgi:pilus biogenesis lipoprotein CpaD